METVDTAALVAGAPMIAAIIGVVKPLLDRVRFPHEAIPPLALGLGVGYVALAVSAGDLDIDGVAAVVLAGLGVGLGAVGTRESVATVRGTGDGS